MTEEQLKENANNLIKHFQVDMGFEDNFDYQLVHTIIQYDGFYLTYKDDLMYYQTNERFVKYMLQVIREFWVEYNEVPSFSQLYQQIRVDNQRLDNEGNITYTPVFKMIEDSFNCVKDNEPRNFKFIEKLFKERLITGIEYTLQHNLKDKILRNKLLRRLAFYETNDVGIPEFQIMKPNDYNEEDNRDIISTNIQLIDENGGIARGEIGMFIAPTGIGKTTLLTYVASQIARQKLNVVHIVFEGRVNHYLKLHKKLMNNNNQYINEHIDVIKMEDGTTTINDVMNTIQMLNKTKTIDAIVIDYIDCIRANEKQKEFWLGESEVVNELEKYSVKNNLVIWTAVQTNRSGLNGEEGEMAQIAGSKKKLDKASMAVFLSRSSLQIEANVATMKIDKNRNGSKSKAVNFEYDPSNMIINTQNILTL